MTEPAAQPDDLTAEEARDLATELGIDLYRAQDALAFVGECCDIAEREQKPITVGDVREWLKGARCGRQLAAEQPATLAALAAVIEVRDPCPHCESSPDLIPRHRMAAHIAEQHPEVRTSGPGIPVPDTVVACGPACSEQHTYDWTCEQFAGIDNGPSLPRITAHPVTPEMERAATARVVQAAADRERAEAWIRAHSSPHPAEAALDRVRALIDEHPVAVGTHLLEEALDQAAHDGGPSVREAAADDRAHWTQKYAGEGP